MGIQERTPPTAEEYDRWRTDYSNWGRWGDDDELGTLNFVDRRRAPRRRRARAGRPRRSRAPGRSTPSRAPPTPTRRGTWWRCRTRARCATTSRCSSTASPRRTSTRSATSRRGGRTTPGTASSSTSTACRSTHRGTIDFWREGIVTRGVLYDIPRLRGTEFVDAGRTGARLGARRRRRRRRA